MKNFTNTIKNSVKLLLKKRYPFKTQQKIPALWLGNEYGGFFVATQFLKKESVVMSFGIGEDISFDTAILNASGCTVHGFDPTPKSIRWIKEKKSELPGRFSFHEYGIDLKNGFVTFFLPENDNYVSGSLVQNDYMKSQSINVLMKNFRDICLELNLKTVDVVKMDIEGSEYNVVPDILKSGIKVKQILIEFHHRFFVDGFKKNTDLISLLNSNGYKIFAVSDTMEEVSFFNPDF